MSSNLIVNNIEVGAGATIYTAASNTLTFGTNGSEKVRISSGGEVGIGINNPEAYEANGNNLVVGDTTSHNGITILTGTDKDGRLGFADGTGAASYRGMIEYQHGTGTAEFMKIAVAGDERLRIKSDGNVGINTDLVGSQTWRNGKILEIFGGGGNVTGELHIGANRGDSNQSVGSINFFDNSQDSTHRHIALIEADKTGSTSNKRGGDLIFFTKKDNTAAPDEKLRLKSGGQLNLGGSSTQTTHLLHLQSTGDAGIHIRADSDNSGENDNPYLSMSQDGSSAQELKIGQNGDAGQNFPTSLGNSPFIHANNSSAQPLQLAHMDNIVVSIAARKNEIALDDYSGNSIAGMEIWHRGNDTGAALKFSGHNNTGGTPGQKTFTQLTHKGGNLTFNFNHNGTDRLVIGSTGVVSGDLNDTSDIALKKDIESISTSCIDNIKQLNPVTFKWKDTSRKDIGFIAQEVEDILPDLVNGEDGVKSINTIGLVSQLTKALQESISRIETLEAKVAALEGS